MIIHANVFIATPVSCNYFYVYIYIYAVCVTELRVFQTYRNNILICCWSYFKFYRPIKKLVNLYIWDISNYVFPNKPFFPSSSYFRRENFFKIAGQITKLGDSVSALRLKKNNNNRLHINAINTTWYLQKQTTYFT